MTECIFANTALATAQENLRTNRPKGDVKSIVVCPFGKCQATFNIIIKNGEVIKSGKASDGEVCLINTKPSSCDS